MCVLTRDIWYYQIQLLHFEDKKSQAREVYQDFTKFGQGSQGPLVTKSGLEAMFSNDNHKCNIYWILCAKHWAQ